MIFFIQKITDLNVTYIVTAKVIIILQYRKKHLEKLLKNSFFPCLIVVRTVKSQMWRDRKACHATLRVIQKYQRRIYFLPSCTTMPL